MNAYQRIFESFTDDEINQIAQLKRLFERVDGDIAFREAVINNQITTVQQERLKNIGVTFDLQDIAFLWEAMDKTLMINMAKNRGEQYDPEIQELLDRYPLLKLWTRYLQKSYCNRTCTCDTMPDSDNKKFAFWRKRRIASVKSELGHFGHLISHPAFAFELSDGCSVGCWFCSFATKKLKGFLDYNTQRDYFCRIIQHCIEIFGKEQVAMAFGLQGI